MHILITRAAADAADYATALIQDGHTVWYEAVTRAVPATDTELVQLTNAVFHATDIAVTSATAARVVATALAGRAVADLPRLWVIGPKTASALAQKTSTHPTQPTHLATDALTLSQAMLHAGVTTAVWVGAREGRTEGVEHLRTAGVAVTVCPAYATALVDNPLLGQWDDTDLICAFAPSQIESLCRARADRTKPVVAIGNTTAAHARAAGFAVTVATSISPEGVVEAVGAIAALRQIR